MTTVVIEGDEPGIQAPGENQADAAAEVTSAEAAIAVAAIEGETQVRLAEIDLERTEAHLAADAAFAETLAENINEDLETEVATWRTRAEAAETELASLRASLTPPPSSEDQLSPPSASADGLPEAASSEPPAPPEAAEPEAAEAPREPPSRPKKARWI